MVLLSLELKQKVVEQILAGSSINKICREFKLGKSTVYYYYKKILGKKYIEAEFTLSNSEIEGEINGIFAGDGSQYHDKRRGSYQVNVHFGAKNYWYACYVKNLFETFFNKRFRLKYDSETQVRLRIESKKIFQYFQNYLLYNPKIKHCTVQLKECCSSEFKIGFLRGWFDTDGCFCFSSSQKSWRAFYTTTSKKLAEQANEYLTSLAIKNTINVINRKDRDEKTIYNVSVWKRGTDRFIKLVKPMKALRAGNSVR